MSWQSDHHSGDTIDKLTKATQALQDFAWSIFMYIGTIVTFLGSIIALMMIRPWIGVWLIVLWILVVALITYFDKVIVAAIKEKNIFQNKVTSLLVDYLTNIKTLITLRFLEPTEQMVARSIDHSYPAYRTQVRVNELKWFITDTLLQVSLLWVILYYMYVQRSTTGTIVIGTITMIYQYVESASKTFYNLAWQYSGIVQNAANIEGVKELEQAYQTLQKEKWNTDPFHNWTQVAVEHLSFSYEDHEVLSDVSFWFYHGEKIAFVGESGSGKSTLLSLLRGLYNVENVVLKIDGKRYDTLAPLHGETSLIPQDPEIFEETIGFNIALGDDTRDEQTIHHYAKIARFHDIALSLPRGYDTSIKEKGVNLSGWQKQRLALARGLLASEESSIVLLDESTSSVDSINEKKIYTQILKEFHNKTIIAAIHKLHLLPMFDMIYVFDQGKIIESGSFDDLLQYNGSFAQLWDEYQANQNKN